MIVSLTLSLIAVGFLLTSFAARCKNKRRISIVSTQPKEHELIGLGWHMVRLVFNQPMDGNRSHLTLRPAGGGDEFVSPLTRGLSDTLIAAILVTAPGRYTLEWIVETKNGRGAAGKTTFEVGSYEASDPRLPQFAKSLPVPPEQSSMHRLAV